MSSYVPAWVKVDTKRFPRSRDVRGQALEILSPFYASNRDADAKAFAAVMAHLREVDPQHTTILVQVENEIGMLPGARDHAEAAEAAWQGKVPAELMEHLASNIDNLRPNLKAQWQAAGSKTSGTWAEVFGNSPATEEAFQAWEFAKFVEAVAAAGRKELDLPMYTNAALIRTGSQPGQYPSAGPLPHLADIWRAGAPHLDFIAPDIYFPNFAEWADAYVDSGNPLFIPEALRNIDAAANAIYSFGKHGALGFGPFGIESISGNAATMLAGANDVIGQLTPLITAATPDCAKQGDATKAREVATTMTGFLPPTDDQRSPHRIRVGDYNLEATYERVPAPALSDGVINESGQAAGTEKLPAAAIAINTAPDEYVVGGIGVTLTFHDAAPTGDVIGILSCEEGTYDENGNWEHLRWLNGDQTHQGRHVRLEPGRFAIQKVKLYRYR